jgi:hypothetical protein
MKVRLFENDRYTAEAEVLSGIVHEVLKKQFSKAIAIYDTKDFELLLIKECQHLCNIYILQNGVENKQT